MEVETWINRKQDYRKEMKNMTDEEEDAEEKGISENDVRTDEFAADLERLKKMKKENEERLRQVKEAKQELEKAITRVNAQLEYIQYKRNERGDLETGDKLGDGVEKEMVPDG